MTLRAIKFNTISLIKITELSRHSCTIAHAKNYNESLIASRIEAAVAVAVVAAGEDTGGVVAVACDVSDVSFVNQSDRQLSPSTSQRL